jgi:uncharacterized integral membrane protein
MATSPTDPDRNARSGGDGPSERDPDRASRGTPTPPSSPPSGGTGTGTGAGAASSSGDAGAAEPVKPPTPFTQQLGRVTIVVLAALFGVFAVANSQRVDFSWIVGETLAQEAASGEVTGGVPLILLLVAAFAIGSLVTLLVELFVSRGRRARQASAEGRSGKRRSG